MGLRYTHNSGAPDQCSAEPLHGTRHLLGVVTADCHAVNSQLIPISYSSNMTRHPHCEIPVDVCTAIMVCDHMILKDEVPLASSGNHHFHPGIPR